MSKVQRNIEFAITERSAERVVSEMPFIEGIKNPVGVANAGAIIWFSDVTATVLVSEAFRASGGPQGFPLAISINANLVSNQTDGVFKATSVFVKKGRTVSVVRTTVTGAGGKLIADITTSHVLSTK